MKDFATDEQPLHPVSFDAPWPHVPGYRIGVVSDTHGRLPNAAHRALEGADLIVHAGDICGQDILPELELIAPTIAVLGNNDYPGEYGGAVTYERVFERAGLTFKVVHRPRDIRALDADVIVYGHTHVPAHERRGIVHLVNPGSPTRSRSSFGHTVGRLVISPDLLVTFQLVALD